MAERWIGGCRRELLDRTLIWNQDHLLRLLRQYETHHNQHRPHRSLNSAAPLKPLPEPVDLERYHVRRHARISGTRRATRPGAGRHADPAPGRRDSGAGNHGHRGGHRAARSASQLRPQGRGERRGSCTSHRRGRGGTRQPRPARAALSRDAHRAQGLLLSGISSALYIGGGVLVGAVVAWALLRRVAAADAPATLVPVTAGAHPAARAPDSVTTTGVAAGNSPMRHPTGQPSVGPYQSRPARP
ncbi:MAG: integrase core domain-containing protein [Mycobacterium sp.]